MKTIRIVLSILVATVIMAEAQPITAASAPTQQSAQQKSGKGKNKSGKASRTGSSKGNSKGGAKGSSKRSNGRGTSGSKKSAGGAKGSAGNKKGTKKSTAARKETSADVSRQHEATQKEITETKQQLKMNEANIKKGVEELGRLQGDISDSKDKVEAAGKVVSGLDTKISGLESQVAAEEAQLQKLRAEYLKAVKKMRIAGKGNSTLAFLFSSGTFNEALRRMRYLKQFSQWKERQSAEITKKVDVLKANKDALEKSRKEKEIALRKQENAHRELQGRYARQDAIVVELRANGEALKSHLAKKQAEANTLKSRISSLIAAEEANRREQEASARREAEARERKEREAAEARAREERAREKEAQRQAEAEAVKEREAASKPAQSKAEKKEEVKKTPTKPTKASELAKQEKEQKAAAKKQTNKDKKKNETAKKTEKKQDVPPVQKAETSASSSKKSSDYADARRRKPRSEGGKKETPKQESAPTGDNGSFEKMRGSLPKPVSGSCKVTSPFGRHSLPELPDVVYDNPGIDAQVAAGATAQAVYGGNVSGVYVIPGYSTVVIVNHGNYYTVYGNISSPSVKVGDNVKQGQGLGKLAIDEDDKGHSSIHFEVWKNREKLNPTDWVKF